MVDIPRNPTKPNPIYSIYIFKRDLALNNLQWLICHYTKPIYLNHLFNFSGSISLNCSSSLHSLIIWLTVSSTCYYVAYYLFSLQYNWSLWRWFLRRLEELQFLSWGIIIIIIIIIHIQGEYDKFPDFFRMGI